ncbi:universal stress protein [Caballeronia arationis]|uniref:universal stress protein n=1 Tax=Caballeronia arationis TaxID=1777142 RepID=UPI000B35ABCC
MCARPRRDDHRSGEHLRVSGRCGRTIVLEAAAWRADLLIMGTHGQRGAALLADRQRGAGR